jgi:hypothetical protein
MDQHQQSVEFLKDNRSCAQLWLAVGDIIFLLNWDEQYQLQNISYMHILYDVSFILQYHNQNLSSHI